MWIFMSGAFLSIVDENAKEQTRRAGTGRLVVRARIAGDIQRAFGNRVKVEHTPHADYAYRATLTRATVVNAIAKAVAGINYGNFKDSVAYRDHDRHAAYSRVWGEMLRLQKPPRGRHIHPSLDLWDPTDEGGD